MSNPAITHDACDAAAARARAAGTEDGTTAAGLYMDNVPDEDCPRILAGLEHDDPAVAEEVFGALPGPEPDGDAFLGPLLYETACQAAGLNPDDTDLKGYLYQQVYDGYDDAFAGAATAEIIYIARYRAGGSAWHADRTGVQPAGDACASIAGEVTQVGQSYNVRYQRADRPGAMITRWAYPVEYRECPGEIVLQVKTEWLACEDPADPDGTMVWSDCSYDDQAIYHSITDAELAALEVAAELLGEAADQEWDGLAPWEHEGGRS